MILETMNRIDTPYPATSIDRFLLWVANLKISIWFFFTLFLLVLIVIFHGLA